MCKSGILKSVPIHPWFLSIQENMTISFNKISVILYLVCIYYNCTVISKQVQEKELVFECACMMIHDNYICTWSIIINKNPYNSTNNVHNVQNVHNDHNILNAHIFLAFKMFLNVIFVMIINIFIMIIMFIILIMIILCHLLKSISLLLYFSCRHVYSFLFS